MMGLGTVRSGEVMGLRECTGGQWAWGMHGVGDNGPEICMRRAERRGRQAGAE